MNRRYAVRGAIAAAFVGSVAAITIGIGRAAGGGPSPVPDFAAAKQQYLTQQSNQRADNAAGPRASKSVVPSFVPCSPTAFSTASAIDNSSIQIGPDSGDLFATSNQWSGPVGSGANEAYSVWAGMTGRFSSSPGLPAVAVAISTLTADGCGIDRSQVHIYTFSAAGGALRITGASAGVVSLRSQTGATLYFNLASNSFSTQSGKR